MSKILSIWGPEGSCKTTLAFTAPKKIVDLDLELGYDRAAGRFDAAQIVRAAFEKGDKFELPQVIKTGGGAVRSVPRGFIKLRDAILVEFNKACSDASIATIVFDTHTVFWEYIYKAHQEQEDLTSLMPKDYGIPNGIMADVIYYAKSCKKNLVLIHHERDIYITTIDAKGNAVERTTGEKTADGFKHTADLADIEVRMIKRALPQLSQSGKPIPNMPPRITPTCIITKPTIGTSTDELEIVNPTWDKLLSRVAELTLR